MRKEKQLLLDEVKEKIDGAKAVLVTRYKALEPNASWVLRQQLEKLGSQLEVVRKRIFLKAAKQSGLKIDEALLQGHVGVVFVDQADSLPSAKAIFKFSEENSDVLEVLCGQVDGVMMPGSEVEMLSKLPGIDEMRAGLIGLLIAPMAQMLSVLEQKSQQE
jgi:large subunit ribosomal protein L10